LYLALITDKNLDEDVIRTQASAFRWLREWQVVLSFQVGDQTRQVVPDATIEAPHCGIRYFLELDRSTETRKRCQRTVRRYAAAVKRGAYRDLFTDELTPHVLYVTETVARAASLAAAFQELRVDGVTVQALALPAAVSELCQALHGAENAAVGAPDAAWPAGEIREAVGFCRKLYRAYYDELQRRKNEGDAVEWPSWLQDAYDFLAARGAWGG
jgi:hypothetical protein